MTGAFHAQFGEDKILSKIFPGPDSGVCVEVGANDGVNDSNTLYFERLGWNCILVEPNPELCRQIKEVRSSTLYECAASDQSGVATLNIAEGAVRSHGVSTICGDAAALEKIRSYGFVPRPIQVQKRRLDEILADSAISPGFEFLSIDVEGHELEVLRGLSLGHWKPSIVIVEDNSYFSDPGVRSHLAESGYFAFKRTGVNDWYAPASNRSLLCASNKLRYWLTSVAVRLLRGIRRLLRGFKLLIKSA